MNQFGYINESKEDLIRRLNPKENQKEENQRKRLRKRRKRNTPLNIPAKYKKSSIKKDLKLTKRKHYNNHNDNIKRKSLKRNKINKENNGNKVYNRKRKRYNGQNNNLRKNRLKYYNLHLELKPNKSEFIERQKSRYLKGKDYVLGILNIFKSLKTLEICKKIEEIYNQKYKRNTISEICTILVLEKKINKLEIKSKSRGRSKIIWKINH